ncbi:MAG: hydroxymethylbilane synthase [Desulfobacteraceae bacterium 4484_190.1]|nr:MAG: hydroxymethylbilane synthase [Desulfobacteraceae bacterium 4484_190.1]
MLIKLGTRGSKLALVQSNWIKEKIENRRPHAQVELVKIKTVGDKILDSPLSKIGGKGLFVKEIEDALLSKRIHVAVHSMKDVPAELPEGLTISAFPEREDPRDALISSENLKIEQLPVGACVGTSSLRRAAQLLHLRPDLDIVSLRGNIDTRLKKLDSGEMQAIILASAGLKRLGLWNRGFQAISIKQMLPAIGQGALGLEVRSDDNRTIEILDFLNHETTELTVRAERAFLKRLEGSCQVPIAAFAGLNGEELHMQGMVAELDGSKIIRDEIVGNKDEAAEIGINLAEKLSSAGADRILACIYGR